MQELHLPDGKPVAINPEAIAYLHPLGEQATQIGFAGGGTVTVRGSYEEVLVDLGLLEFGHDGGADEDVAPEDFDLEAEAQMREDAPPEDNDPGSEERELRERQRGFF